MNHCKTDRVFETRVLSKIFAPRRRKGQEIGEKDIMRSFIII
jgi:hypothetical protein